MSRPPTWLVTGGSGFLGRHLLDRLRAEPIVAVAVGRRPVEGVRWVPGDLLEPESLRPILADLRPAVVFHLAGRTPPADLDALDRANRVATLGLVDALSALGRPVRLVAAGSAGELGPVPAEGLPVREDWPCRPETDYGRTKLAATSAVLAARPPVEAIVARVFNPIGPGMPASQALGRFAAGLADGSGPLTLGVGDLTPRRDFVDARDVAEALVALAVRGRPGLYHVGTGSSRAVGDGLHELIRLSGREVRVEPGPARPGGPADSRADGSRLRAETGWSPRVSFERSLADLWAAARGGRD